MDGMGMLISGHFKFPLGQPNKKSGQQGSARLLLGGYIGLQTQNLYVR